MHSTINLNLIKRERTRKGLTMAYMATKLGLSGAEKYYRRENGTYKFQVNEIPILASVLNIPMEKIFRSKLLKSQVKS